MQRLLWCKLLYRAKVASMTSITPVIDAPVGARQKESIVRQGEWEGVRKWGGGRNVVRFSFLENIMKSGVILNYQNFNLAAVKKIFQVNSDFKNMNETIFILSYILILILITCQHMAQK